MGGCCCCQDANGSSATVTHKALLLGAAGSGKTQLGHLLSGRRRDSDDCGPTNGVRCYRLPGDDTTATAELALTEVGGNAEMQRLWPHYYAATHALIFCFDLSAGCAEALEAAFALLQRCLEHAELRGKAVLLVANGYSDSIQLYDVEHAFGLEALARRFSCPLHICHGEGAELWQGVAWLRRQLQEQAPALAERIKYDVNMQSWVRRRRLVLSSAKLAQVHRQRFRRQHRKLWPLPQDIDAATPTAEETGRRPRTAPASIFFIRSSSSSVAPAPPRD